MTDPYLTALAQHADDMRAAVDQLNTAVATIKRLQAENDKLTEMLKSTMEIADRLMKQRT